MPDFDNIQQVTGGTRTGRTKINSAIDVANSVRAVRGDGFVRSNHGPDGVALSLDIEAIQQRLPTYSRVKYGAAANIDARSDACAWIRPGGDEGPHCYVKEVVLDFPFENQPGSSGFVTADNAEQFTKVYFPGNGDPIVIAGDLVPYVLVKDETNAEPPYGICVSGGFSDLPLGATHLWFNALQTPHDGWVLSGQSGRTVGLSVSDPGTSVTMPNFDARVPVGTGSLSNQILGPVLAGANDSAYLITTSTPLVDNVLYGVGCLYYTRVF